MKLDQIRADFPLLQKTFNRKPPIYFDNACMTLRPRPVIEALVEYYESYSACAGRSNHQLARRVNDAVHEARKKVAKFLNSKRLEEVVFTRNTTEGLNLVARSLKWQDGDVIITTDKEHNSNLVPWLILAEKKGLKHVIVRSKPDNTFDVEAFKQVLDQHSGKVKLVSMAMTSNLDGVSIPVKEIISLAHKAKALVMLDAAQGVPHQKLDVRALDVDFLAFSGHKMCGPSGMGVFYGKYSLLEQLSGFMVGGDTVEYTTYDSFKLLPPPEKFEAGLQDYAGMIGLGATVEYLTKVGLDQIHQHEHTLNQIITQGIQDLPGLTIIGPQDPALRGGVVSFYVDGVDVHQIALMLDQAANIMVRSGQHCVHSWFHAHNLNGSARASLYFYNTEEEAEMFVQHLKNVLSVLR